MRDNVRTFVRLAADWLDLRGPIYEFGSYLVDGQEGAGDLRPMFPGRRFTGCDMRPGPGVDRLEDLAQLSLPDRIAGTVLCLDTLEHVFEARRAAEELVRVLAPGGALVVSIPMHFRIHAYPDDFWRFTPACIDRLLSGLDARMIGWQGVESFPHTVLALAFKPPYASDLPTRLNHLMRDYQAWLDEQAAQRPLRTRVKRWLTSWARSRAERRAWREEYQVRFALQFPSSGATPSLQMAAWAGVAGGAGGRIDLS